MVTGGLIEARQPATSADANERMTNMKTSFFITGLLIQTNRNRRCSRWALHCCSYTWRYTRRQNRRQQECSRCGHLPIRPVRSIHQLDWKNKSDKSARELQLLIVFFRVQQVFQKAK